MTAARGAAPRRGRRFARSRRFRPSERRFAWRAHTRSGRASRSRRSWRERFPTRPPSLDRSSPSSARIRGPKQIAALSRHRSRAPVPHRVHSEDGATPSPDTNAPRLERVGRPACRLALAPGGRGSDEPYRGPRRSSTGARRSRQSAHALPAFRTSSVDEKCPPLRRKRPGPARLLSRIVAMEPKVPSVVARGAVAGAALPLTRRDGEGHHSPPKSSPSGLRREGAAKAELSPPPPDAVTDRAWARRASGSKVDGQE